MILNMNISGLQGLRNLQLSDTEVGSDGLRHLSGRFIFYICVGFSDA